MAETFSLITTNFSLSIGGGENQIIGSQSYGLPFNYLFGPKQLTNGSGIGLALRAFFLPITLPAIAAPGSAPAASLASSTGGSIAAGNYTFAIAWVTAAGTGIISPASGVLTIASGTTNQVTVTGPSSLPSGATAMNVYLITTTGTGTNGTLVGTASATNTLTLTALPNSGALASATLNGATLPTQIDLTSSFSTTGLVAGVNQFNAQDPPTYSSPAPSGVNFSLNGSGSAGNGVKAWAIENTDTITTGQILTVGGGTNAWTNALGSGTFPINGGGVRGAFDPTGFVVASGNKIIQLIAKYGTPTVNLILVGEGQ